MKLGFGSVFRKENNMVIINPKNYLDKNDQISNNDSCNHIYKYLGQKRIDANHGKTKLTDVFYCEKCLKYEYR